MSGVAAAVVGGALLAAGAVIGSTFGPDGTVSTAPATATASGVALLVDGLEVDAGGLPVMLEESVFFASPDGARACQQIVVTGKAEAGAEVQWAFSRL